MELRIPKKFKEVLEQNSALSSLVNGSLNEFGEWLRQNNLKFFTEYTDHSLEHVQSVLEMADGLIRDECRAFITPHDVATLILAILLHDSAMHISEDGFINLVNEEITPNFVGFTDKSWKTLWGEFLAESRRFSGRKLISLFGDSNPVRHPPLENPQELNGKDLLLCGEFLRRHHSRLAHEIALYGVPGPNGRILKLPATEDTAHVIDLAGLIARSHGLSIRECFEYLRTLYSSVKMVRGVHPTFLMVLLRIADILQIQSDRAPKQVLKIKQLKSPISSGEWEMHQAIKDINFREFPETVWVVTKPENVKTYLRIRKMLDEIQSELDLSWTVIGEVYGYDPEFREFGLKIRRVRSNIDDINSFSKQISFIPVHASFEVADTDLLKLLIGPLYGEKAEIGIRELLQNSLDAVNELNEYQKQLKNINLEFMEQSEDVLISIEQNDNKDWWLTISDRGIGMTVNIIKEYFLKAGASLRRSEIWKKTFEDSEGKSKILRSGRFGIGALAAFLIGDEIKVSTRHVSATSNQGIEFNAQIDTESIEIRHTERPIGTTISIKLKESAIKSLIPQFDDSEYLSKSKIKSWDWYYLEKPVVARKLNQKNLHQSKSVPGINSDLPFGWHRIRNPKFEDIHWSYLPSVPELVCNGIGIVDQVRGRLSKAIKDKYVAFERPNLSVFDFNANFPLNIQRTSITTPNLPFEKELLEDIIKDFIAFTLIEAPKQKSPIGITTKQFFSPQHYITIFDAISSGYTDIPIWISTNFGTGIFCDPLLFKKRATKSTIVMFSYQNDSDFPKIPSAENFDTLWMPIDSSNSILGALNTSIGKGLGLDFNRFGQDEIFALKVASFGNALRGARLLVHKKIIQAFTDVRKTSPVQYDIFEDINNINLPILTENEVEGYLRDKSLLQQRNSIIRKEWENENWLLLSTGDCPVTQFDFEKVANDHATAEFTKWPCLIAEWYFEETIHRDNSMLSQIWEDVIGSPLIPYDIDERKKTLSHAYKELSDYIENYKATKELIETARKKMREQE